MQHHEGDLISPHGVFNRSPIYAELEPEPVPELVQEPVQELRPVSAQEPEQAQEPVLVPELQRASALQPFCSLL